MKRPLAPLEPRLLTPEQAAQYLGYASTAVLAGIPIAPVHVAGSGVGKGPRYDRKALDAWLDRLSGLSGPPAALAAVPGPEEADDKLAAWRARKAARGAG